MDEPMKAAPILTQDAADHDGEPTFSLSWQAGAAAQADLGGRSMKPHGTVEAYIGSAKQSPGVSMALSLVWLRGRLHLRIQEEPRGPTPPKRPFRCFHVRSERLPQVIARLQEAHYTAIGLGMKKGGTTR